MAIAIATRDITIRTIIANSNPMIILLNHHTLNKLIPGILEISKTICRTSLILENIIIQPNHQVPMSLEARVRLSKTHSLNMNPKIPNNMNITMNDKKKASRKSIGKTKLILLNMIHLNWNNAEWDVAASLIRIVLPSMRRTARRYSRKKENNSILKNIDSSIKHKPNLWSKGKRSKRKSKEQEWLKKCQNGRLNLWLLGPNWSKIGGIKFQGKIWRWFNRLRIQVEFNANFVAGNSTSKPQPGT